MVRASYVKSSVFRGGEFLPLVCDLGFESLQTFYMHYKALTH